MEHKTLKKPLSKTATGIIYSVVFILIGIVLTDVTTRDHYVIHALVTLGIGWLLMFALQKKGKIPQGKGPNNPELIFCFKCQKIHEDNSICEFVRECNDKNLYTDSQTGSKFCVNCGERDQDHL